MGGPDIAHRLSAIHSAAWMVRHYARGYGHRPTSPLRIKRDNAIRELGLLVREAMNSSEDFEPLLAAVVDGLRPRLEEQPF